MSPWSAACSHVPGVLAVPQLTVVLDGVRYPPCTDVPIPPNTLPWPDGHLLLPVPEPAP